MPNPPSEQQAPTLLDQANIALDEGNEGHAVELLTQAIALVPTSAILVQSRGAVRAMLDDSDGAIADYTRAIELEPAYADAYVNRGLAYWEKGDHRRAAHDLGAAVELGIHVEDVELQARYFLARAHEVLGEVAPAYDHYLRVIVLSPTSSYAQDAGARSLALKIRAEGNETTKRAVKKPAPAKKQKAAATKKPTPTAKTKAPPAKKQTPAKKTPPAKKSPANKKSPKRAR